MDMFSFSDSRGPEMLTDKPMERMADIIHLTKCMRNKISKANFSAQNVQIILSKGTQISARKVSKRYVVSCVGRVSTHV